MLKVGDKTTILMHREFGMLQPLEIAEHIEVTVTKVEQLEGKQIRYTATKPRLVQWVEGEK